MKSRLLAGALLFAAGLRAAASQPSPAAAAIPAGSSSELESITVTAERLQLIGTATTASEGLVVNDELALLPVYRPGQLLETVPGLDVTAHSGEGKANQYLMRGYNLDHGTDLAVFVDGMPVNEPTHAHGQGYTDLNFLIPELATNISYTKGTYYASEGDFASVGAVHINYLNTLQDQVSLTAGTLDFQRVFAGGSMALGKGTLLAALELQHYDGPWVSADDQRKINSLLRYSAGDGQDGYSITGSYYHDLWNATTDQPVRAVTAGLIDRFGSLNPSDGGLAQRANLSGQYYATLGAGQLIIDGYVFNNFLTLWNDFTHFLIDPINGDQEEQHENRNTVGGSISYARPTEWFRKDNELLVGVQERYDVLTVQRLPTENRNAMPLADDPLGYSSTDYVHLGSSAVYTQATTHWNEWFRTVLGLREDYQRGSDAGTNFGPANQALFEPKASLIFTPSTTTEFYLSGGRGFHSDDLRGVNQAARSGVPGAPLIAEQTGEEIGMRQVLFDGRVALTLAVFNLDAQSETTYDPDVGQDTAGPGSRRTGYELNITYQALSWLELYGSFSQDRARFTSPFADGTGHVGYYLPNAPFATGSLTAYVRDRGPWSGSLALRYLAAYPLSSDDVVQGSGYHEWNADVRYAFGNGWGAALGMYNILNTKANAAEFWYVDRLPGEPVAGVADVHIHPLEPISARLTLSKKF
ncbi:MAG TPA: TonB-dependent receptor plug domain-containing protein [Steroidobacteraceae bacterium]|nr:TonB-dependent receptor plug domain-containing protein [Steroidobacteraceae bacterium]